MFAMEKERDMATAWREWRDQRDTALAEEHGWLSLISFTWLSEERSRLAHFPGYWYTDRDEAAGSFRKGTSSTTHSADVRRNGESFAGEAVFALEDGESDFSLSSGTRVAEVVRRGGRYAVRVRDSSAPTLLAFQGVPVFDFDPQAVVVGEFIAYDEPREVPIETARKSVSGRVTLVGDVEFTYAGEQCRLAVQGRQDGELTAVFYDASNGTTTADWRSVSFAGPGGPRGSVTIDFNRAVNFPSAFTPFGTCPKPPEGNTLQVSVLAGERRPAPWIDPGASVQ